MIRVIGFLWERRSNFCNLEGNLSLAEGPSRLNRDGEGKICFMRTKVIYIAFILFSCFVCTSQTKTTVYFFPGQGSDRRLFDSLTLDSAFKTKVIEYGTPSKHLTLKEFAGELAKQIDTTEKFMLVGVSLGGMICTELNEILNPQKTVIISSAKNRSELPVRYKFQKVIPLYKIFPGSFLLAGAKVMQPLVEPDRNKNKKVFKSMLGQKNALYMKRTIKLIIKWDRKTNTKPVYHIHGTNDHTLPIRKMSSVNYVVKHGSHMMTLTRAKEISVILNEILLGKSP
jgi:pimeloyl-ACP methyl ester carboxylesterase